MTRDFRKEAIETSQAIYGQNSNFAEAVIHFAAEGFESAMKRKTWKETDEKMLALLDEMVTILKKEKGKKA